MHAVQQLAFPRSLNLCLQFSLWRKLLLVWQRICSADWRIKFGSRHFVQGKIKKETFNDKCCALGIKHEDLRMFNDTSLEQFCSSFFETPLVHLKSCFFLCVFFVFINENKKSEKSPSVWKFIHQAASDNELLLSGPISTKIYLLFPIIQLL